MVPASPGTTSIMNLGSTTRLQLFAAGLAAFFLISCEIINPAEDIPVYLTANGYSLSTGTGQGTASHNITDVWVYVDQETQGVYEMPSTFPILAEGQKKLSVRPGIIMNGIASTRTWYPFFKEKNIDFEFIPGRHDTLTLTTTYKDNIKFPWIEGFENPGITITRMGASDTVVTKVTDAASVFEGNASGAIFLDKDHSFFEGMSTQEFVLPGSQEPVYIEMNYKTDNYLTVGLIANTSGSVNVLPILVLNPAGEWKKIYIYLTNTINRQTLVKDFNIYFTASLDTGAETGEILIDNIKLVHF